MTKEELLKKICPSNRTSDCVCGASLYDCEDCNTIIGVMLDKYEKKIRAEAVKEFAKWLEEKEFLFDVRFGGDADYDELSAEDVLAKYGEEQK